MHLARTFTVNTTANDLDQFRTLSPKDDARANWVKSSLSTYNGTCVEIAHLSNNRVGMRDTKDHGTGTILAFSQREWSAFLAGAKAGEFNLDRIDHT